MERPLPLLASRRVICALVAFLVPATLFAAPSNPTDAPAATSLKGQLLIATPSMRDPRFDHAVILIIRHDREGALGIVINRPLGEKPLAELLTVFGLKDAPAATGTVRIFLGGPVQPEVSLVVHSPDYHSAVTLDVNGRFGMTASREVLRDLADKAGPMKSLVAFGYAGWGAGQLEGELAHNVWYTAPADAALVFDDDRDKVWEHATARRTQDL
jgi:putative transcriptional regulator